VSPKRGLDLSLANFSDVFLDDGGHDNVPLVIHRKSLYRRWLDVTTKDDIKTARQSEAER